MPIESYKKVPNNIEKIFRFPKTYRDGYLNADEVNAFNEFQIHVERSTESVNGSRRLDV